MTETTRLQCRVRWVLLPLLLTWGCAGGYGPRHGDGYVPPAQTDSGFAFPGSDVVIPGQDSTLGQSDSGGNGGWLVDSGAAGGGTLDSGLPPCQPSCTGKTCGASDGCGATCKAGSGCCTPSCTSKLCGASDGCGATCKAGSGCCTPSCSGKSCGASDGCGGTCKIGSGCYTSCGTWQAANPDDPWDDSDPNYDGERRCSGTLIKDFGKVSLEANCRTKCEKVAATCCLRDHRSGQKSCKAYTGKVVVYSSCSGCTAASCK